MIGTCSKECGGGKRTNTREVKIEPANGGKNCSGISEIAEDCNIEDCPGMGLIEKLLQISTFSLILCENHFNVTKTT